MFRYLWLFALSLSASLAAAQSTDPSWELLSEIEIKETINGDMWSAEKTYPDDLTTEEPFTITGYYVPLMAQAYQSQILLVPDPADCPFCGTNSYGPTLEVRLDRPLPDLPQFTLLTVTGQLEKIEDPETWQAIRLVGADWQVEES